MEFRKEKCRGRWVSKSLGPHGGVPSSKNTARTVDDFSRQTDCSSVEASTNDTALLNSTSFRTIMLALLSP